MHKKAGLDPPGIKPDQKIRYLPLNRALALGIAKTGTRNSRLPTPRQKLPPVEIGYNVISHNDVCL